jgi:hypothetical protein
MLCLMKLASEGTPNDCTNSKKTIRDALIEFVATCLFIYASIMRKFIYFFLINSNRAFSNKKTVIL